ncbi:hypothetical protein, partial [Halomonas sp. ND22Bw]|uniref:hypothetical protein n=1 Tax=Halomonas sp. ND22Bw TaxID=2054178 RepID=UPI001C63242E
RTILTLSGYFSQKGFTVRDSWLKVCDQRNALLNAGARRALDSIASFLSCCRMSTSAAFSISLKGTLND